MILIIIISAICGGVLGYSIAVANDECPMTILGYNCKGDFCNHSKAEVRRAKDTMRGPRPPFNQFKP